MTTFPFAAVGFDLDGTLLDTSGDLGAAVNHALGIADRAPVPAESVRGLIGGGARVMLARALELTGGAVPEAEMDRLFAALLEFYEANIAVHTRPYPGLVEALDALSGAGVVLGVATNKRERLARKVLRETGLLDRFACVLGPDTLGPDTGKPKPDMLLELQRRCGGGPTAYVGDSSFDARAAAAAAMPGVIVSFGFNDAPAAALGGTVVIDSYRELVPVLRTLAPG